MTRFCSMYDAPDDFGHERIDPFGVRAQRLYVP
jgi:hypothetical protein